MFEQLEWFEMIWGFGEAAGRFGGRHPEVATADWLGRILTETGPDQLSWFFHLQEPRFAKTMKESLHEAQRLRMMGDESGHVRMALKTVELMEKMTPSQRLGTAKLNNTEARQKSRLYLSSLKVRCQLDPKNVG